MYRVETGSQQIGAAKAVTPMGADESGADESCAGESSALSAVHPFLVTASVPFGLPINLFGRCVLRDCDSKGLATFIFSRPVKNTRGATGIELISLKLATFIS